MKGFVLMEAARTKHKKRWLFWGLAAFFYLYEYFLRVSPTVMVPEIMQAFNKKAVGIGSLSSAYLYTYALCQIPVGMLMDRFGARKLLSLASVICTIGCGFYGFGSKFIFLIIGRIFLGAGSAFAFIGMVYICSHWFEKRKVATLLAVGNSLGMVGAIAGEGPLALSVDRFGWRMPMLALGAIGLLLALIMFFTMTGDSAHPIEKQEQKAREKVNVVENLKSVAKNPQTWLVGIATFLIYSTTTAFAALWGVPFLESAYNMKKDAASFAISMIFVGWIIGGPIIGRLSDVTRHRRAWLIVASICGALSMSLLIYYLQLNRILLYILLALIGFFSSAQNLCYILAIEHNEKKAKGVASAFTNFLLFLGAANIPILVGSLLNAFWTGGMRGGVPFYSPKNFQIALTTFPITFILAAIFFIIIKKSPSVSKNEK